jgi:glucosamine-phosphate N-acetyltransferase
MATADLLFSADLVSPEIQSILPEGYTLRPLQRSDFGAGHLDVLRDLAHVGDITEEDWIGRYDWMKSCHGSYYVLVIVNQGGTVVGTGTLFFENNL